jgi:hypothetical protein
MSLVAMAQWKRPRLCSVLVCVWAILAPRSCAGTSSPCATQRTLLFVHRSGRFPSHALRRRCTITPLRSETETQTDVEGSASRDDDALQVWSPSTRRIVSLLAATGCVEASYLTYAKGTDQVSKRTSERTEAQALSVCMHAACTFVRAKRLQSSAARAFLHLLGCASNDPSCRAILHCSLGGCSAACQARA